jgi:transposase-like protein
MGTQLQPAPPCPVCKVAMVHEPGDTSLGYDVFVCKNCGTKFLVHHLTPDSEDDD